jgi:hypothetical protein
MIVPKQQSGNVLINSDYIANNSSEVAPESTNQVQETQELVAFSDDKAVIPEKMPGEHPLSGPENQQHTDWAQHSIISFMQRPQLIGDYNWVKTLERGYVVDNLDILIPGDGLTSSKGMLTPMILNKLDGFTSFRATAVVKLQVNSQPFQQGRLIMAAIPMPTLISPRDSYLLKHPTYLQSINHVQIDISKQTEISLRIPFISPFNSYNLIENKYPWARLAVVVYSQLRDPTDGGGNVPLRLWAHFEDIELGAPTSGIFGLPNGPIIPPAKAIQQAGKMKEPTAKQVKVTQAIESQGNPGIVQVLGGAAQSVYKTIGDNVPFLQPITNIFSALSKFGTTFAGGILSFLGFSKPQIGYSGSSVLVRPCEYFGNANGIDHSHVLALDRMNNVDMYPGLGGTSCDEMSFDFLKRIPQFVDYFEYSSTSAPGLLMFDSWVTPSYYAPGYLRMIGPAITGIACPKSRREIKARQPTVLNYVSSSFMYWTGSLVYTFRFVKTDFHSGRVEISFHPFTNNSGISRINYVYRLVVDLRENTEVSVSVPFISPQPWKAFLSLSPMSPGLWEQYGPCSTGKIQMRAITPLILSNAVVEKNIECLVEVRAGDDFRVQGPCRSGYYPFTTPGLLTSTNVPKQQSGPYALPGTSETRTTAIEGLIPDSITHGGVDIHRVDTRMLCSGEIFENFRDLIKRFCFVEKYLSFPSKTGVLSRSVPFYLRAPEITATSYISKAPHEGNGFNQFAFERNVTPLSFVSALYAFYRGGLRLKIYTPNKDIKLVSGRVLDVTDLPGPYAPGRPAISVRRIASFMAPTAFELIQGKGFAEFQMPFYSPVYLSIPWDSQRLSLFDQSSARIEVSFSNEAESLDVYVAVAAADDMTFHGFIGVPPVMPLEWINDYYVLNDSSGDNIPGSEVSYIDTTNMNVDPTYPITKFTPDTSIWVQAGSVNAPIPIDSLQACPSKAVVNACDTTGDARCIYPVPPTRSDRVPGHWKKH